ncbi:MAG: DnaB-like helicase C-terminal domain-containing protein, partial [Rhodospirillaceae bacterium]
RSYARTVRDLARRRDLMAISEDLADAAAAPKFDVSADDIALKASGEIERVMGDGEDGGPQDMATTVAQALRTLDDARKDDGAALAIPTGIAELDHQIGGLAVSEVSVLGARPGMGKTAVAAQIALNVALSSRPVLFFSLEMAADQIMHRLICGEANINSSRPHMRGMTAIERQAYTETANRLSSAPLFIDTHAEAVSQIVARSQAWHRAGRCSLVVIDYLGLIQPDDRYKGNKVYELAEITRALKTRIANRLHVPVLLLAQLNRGVEGRDDKRPTLADLRDSGAIEQDAGLVMFLFREAYYLERKLERTPGEEADLQASRTELEIIIAKNRHGPANREARTTFDPSTTRVGRRQESMDFGEEVPV